MSSNKCLIPACSRTAFHKTHGLCQAHYKRYARNGDPGKSKVRKYRKVTPYIQLVNEKGSLTVKGDSHES